MIEQLILIRHGETVQNAAGIAQGWNDSALSELGERQVRAVAERLHVFRADALYSSPLGRAMSTARVIADVLGLEIRTLDGMREMGYGRWEGQSFLDVRKADYEIYKRWSSDADCRCPEGESHNDVAQRIAAALEQIDAARPIVVTHGTAIRIAATVLMNLPVMSSRHFAQDNAAINLFENRGGRIVLKLWNDTNHY
ncbi:MAG TPA: histidine phosphatase family protein [Thermoanaerobaculia bacterium]|nr:histidine phosphatase family protein [Thermoanaerobaculia bacterium]